MTSEWGHVPPISTKNKVLRKSPPRVQFWSYVQLTYKKWRRISRAKNLLFRIFEILKISKNKIFNFFFFKMFTLKNFFYLKKPLYMLGGNGLLICVQNLKSISSKTAEIWQNMQKKALYKSFRDLTVISWMLFCDRFWRFKKCLRVIFRVLCENLT